MNLGREKLMHRFFLFEGVAQKSNGSLLYTDMDRGIVSSHDGDSLEFEYRWTCRLLSDRYVPSPAFLTVDADDYIFIADSQNNCIKVRQLLNFLTCAKSRFETARVLKT